MNKRSYLGLSLLSTLCGVGIVGFGVVGCGDDSSGEDVMDASVPSSSMLPTNSLPSQATSAASSTLPTMAVASSAASTSAMPPVSAGGMGGMGDTGEGGAGAASTGGSGGTCDVAGLAVFTRSDTEAVWDDNDFSDVVVEGTCPVLVNATWPHEAGWQDADPAEANQEQVHFTLDSGYSGDLTGKQLNLTIELADSQLGPSATAAGYLVSLVSVSSFTRTVVVEPASLDAGVSDAGIGDAGLSLDAAVAVDAAVSAAGDAALLSDAGATALSDAAIADGGLDASVVDPGPVTMTETGYSEAQSVLEDRLILRHVGDRATVTFALPNKTAEEDSYDPTRVIKINVRIYNMAPSVEAVSPAADAGVEPNETPDAGVSLELDAGMSLADAAVDSDGAVSEPDIAVSTPEVVAVPGAGARVYDYTSARFAITSFTVTDVTGL